MNLPKLIVFDMDGVIIDVSRSYRETARKTARRFFQGARGFKMLPDPLFPLADLAGLKQTGGLNNDWELTSQVISLLFARVNAPIAPEASDDSSSYEETIRRCDVSDLAGYLTASPTPLMELLAGHGKRREPFVEHCFRGDVGTGNVIKQIFQEIYLGRVLFTAVYSREPMFCREDGLIHQESLLIDTTILEGLSRKHILAIATGRPRVEANFPLDHFSLRRYFRQVITLDDCTREEERLFQEQGKRISLSKPNPFMLDLIPRMIGDKFAGCYYLGDMPDDMQAAGSSQTGYRSIGVAFPSPDQKTIKQALLNAGAEYLLDNYAVLPEIIDNPV
jgi:phosphoglycolate phosphatase-like HAD superfamily hydrolase